MKTWIRTHVFTVHLAAFLLMVFSSIPLYYAAKADNLPAVIVLMIMFVLGNLLAIAAP